MDKNEKISIKLKSAWENPDSGFHSKDRIEKISLKLKESWKDPTSGLNSKERSKKLSESTKRLMRDGSPHKNKLIKIVKKKWKDPNSKFNSDEYRKKLTESGKKRFYEKLESNNSIKCSYGCNNLAKYYFPKSNKYCCSKSWQSCPNKRKESSDLIKKELEKPNSWFNSKECSYKRRTYMLNGGASFAYSFNKSISKPQIKLFELIQQICPYPILEYPILNYHVDIGIPILNIAVEYDGSYFHQDKDYDIERQTKIENEGWIFLRYVDDVPDKNKIFTDIMEKING